MSLGKVSRKGVLLIVFATLLAGVIVGQHYKASSDSRKHEASTDLKSKNPALDFTFEYPSTGWTPKESRGTAQKYDAVQLLGPSNPKEEYGVYISVGVRALKSGQSSEDLLGLFLEETKRFKGFKILEKKQVEIQGHDYFCATFEHFLMLPLWKKNAKDVLIKKTVVFMTRNNRSYRISCAGTAEQFNRFSGVFEKALKTFRFTS